MALVSFSQGKEYAGQERATGAAVLATGRLDEQAAQRLRRLIGAQEQAFRIFAEFADAQANVRFERLSAAEDFPALQDRRDIDLNGAGQTLRARPTTADRWFEITTRRIDAMKQIEDDFARTLGSSARRISPRRRLGATRPTRVCRHMTCHQQPSRC